MDLKCILTCFILTTGFCLLVGGQIKDGPDGPDAIIQKLELAGVFEVPEFSLTSEYDAYRTHDHLHGLFFDALPYHGDSTKVFCWYGFPEDVPEGDKVPAVVLVHGGGA